MSNKTTMILTFIVTVVVPFVQEVVDLIEALKGRSTASTQLFSKVASDFSHDVDKLVEPASSKDNSNKTSRFFGSWRENK